MHDCGIYHRDLNVKNILVREGPEGLEAFVIDFDRAILMTSVPLDARMKNLLRLDRSILKWPALRNRVTVTDRLRLMREYLQTYPQWSTQWQQILSAYETRHTRHRLTRIRDEAEEAAHSSAIIQPPEKA
jgi:tRNA A-37 threonylcarbamoyl transferase component Bud32